MYLLYCLHLLWLIPASWIDCFLVRGKSFEVRYMHIARWCKRFFHYLHIKLEVSSEEELPSDGSILFVSNHQSFFDLFMLEAGIPIPFTFVSKKENKKIPYLSSLSKNLELIYFDREDQSSAIHMLRESTRRLKTSQNVLIFPEGTRSKDTKMKEMQAGSIQPAFMAKSYLVPVVLYNSFEYKKLLKSHGVFRMHIGKALPHKEYKALKAEGMIQQLQQQMETQMNQYIKENDGI